MIQSAGAAKLFSFKLQPGKTQQEVVQALREIEQYFSDKANAASGVFLHDATEDTYYIFAPGDSLETLDEQGKAMISSGAGDRLFAVVDPPTFKSVDCVALDLQ